MAAHLWIRAEARPTERRTPIVPADAARLVAAGVRVTVEESPRRIFPIDQYAEAGCATAPTGSWVDAPADACIVGIKELPDSDEPLRHTHIYFAHSFKGQEGSAEVLDRFRRGGGELLDIEYLTVDGRRVVAFGRWAGYVGAALGVLALHGPLPTPLEPSSRADFDARLAGAGAGVRALVIGSRGRSGHGAIEALAVADADVTAWDRSETDHLDHEALLDNDLLVNCIVAATEGEPFVRPVDLDAPRRLRIVADVTCDVTSAANRIPVNTAITTWAEPVRSVAPDLGVIAVDNLPSLLPAEASESFSAELTPLIADLPTRSGPWASALASFRRALTG